MVGTGALIARLGELAGKWRGEPRGGGAKEARGDGAWKEERGEAAGEGEELMAVDMRWETSAAPGKKRGQCKARSGTAGPGSRGSSYWWAIGRNRRSERAERTGQAHEAASQEQRALGCSSEAGTTTSLYGCATATEALTWESTAAARALTAARQHCRFDELGSRKAGSGSQSKKSLQLS